MNRSPFNGDGGLSSVKSLVFNLPGIAIIQGIRKVGCKAFRIKLIGPNSDFFIRTEAKFNQSVFDFWVSQQITSGGNCPGNPGLIINTQQGGAVTGD